MSVLARLLRFWTRERAEIGPDLVDAVGDPGSHNAVPTEAAVRAALGGGSHTTLTDRDDANQHPESAIAFTDITDGNATTDKHGYLPKLDGTSTKYLAGDGTWLDLPEGGGGVQLDEANTFTAAQSVSATALASDMGEVTWDTAAKQNTELEMTEDITDWVIQNGVVGRPLVLRLYKSGGTTCTFSSSIFKNTSTLVMPANGFVTYLSFIMRTTTVLEFLGQSPEFEEWGL